MARHNTRFDVFRAHGNGRYFLQLAAPVFAANAWLAGFV